MKTFIEIIGWYGALAILSAYALVSFEILSPASLPYHLLNGTGALGIVIAAFRKHDYQPAVLNIIWMIVAAVAIASIII